jgi:hypothetical protein
VLDDLEGGNDARGFGEVFHECIIPLMFHPSKNHALTYAEGVQVEAVLGCSGLDTSTVSASSKTIRVFNHNKRASNVISYW